MRLSIKLRTLSIITKRPIEATFYPSTAVICSLYILLPWSWWLVFKLCWLLCLPERRAISYKWLYIILSFVWGGWILLYITRHLPSPLLFYPFMLTCEHKSPPREDWIDLIVTVKCFWPRGFKIKWIFDQCRGLVAEFLLIFTLTLEYHHSPHRVEISLSPLAHLFIISL